MHRQLYDSCHKEPKNNTINTLGQQFNINLEIKVYIESTNIRTEHSSKNLDDKRYGLFEVIKKIGHTSYRLKLLETWHGIHTVINKSYSTLYQPPKYCHQKEACIITSN